MVMLLLFAGIVFLLTGLFLGSPVVFGALSLLCFLAILAVEGISEWWHQSGPTPGAG